MSREGHEFIIRGSTRHECGIIMRNLYPELKRLSEQYSGTSCRLAYLNDIDDAYNYIWDDEAVDTLPGFPLVFINITFDPECFDFEEYARLKEHYRMSEI